MSEIKDFGIQDNLDFGSVDQCVAPPTKLGRDVVRPTALRLSSYYFCSPCTFATTYVYAYSALYDWNADNPDTKPVQRIYLARGFQRRFREERADGNGAEHSDFG